MIRRRALPWSARSLYFESARKPNPTSQLAGSLSVGGGILTGHLRQRNDDVAIPPRLGHPYSFVSVVPVPSRIEQQLDYSNIETLVNTSSGFLVSGEFGVVNIEGGSMVFSVCA